jgi:hypothetical protein
MRKVDRLVKEVELMSAMHVTLMSRPEDEWMERNRGTWILNCDTAPMGECPDITSTRAFFPKSVSTLKN